MIHRLIPWRQLTRNGVPPLKVARRPLVLSEVTVPVGDTFNPELFPFMIRALRLRQLYEQRLLEPVDPPPTSQQFYREQYARMHGSGIDQELPVAPITPVASRVVADGPVVDLPVVEVPVEEEPPKRKPSKGAK